MKDMEIIETSSGEPPPNLFYLRFKWVVSSSKKSTQSSRFSLSTSPAPLFCFSLPKISPFFQPPVLFLFHATFLCSLLLLRSSFPTISFQSSPFPTTPLLNCFNCRHGLRVVTSLPCVSCMQLHGSCPPLQKNIFSSSPGWYKIPFGAIDKSNNNKH